MVKCDQCKKDIFFWKTYSPSETGLTLCETCYLAGTWKKSKEKRESVQKEEVKRDGKKVQEYKRKCNQCGKVWHSLVSTEKSKAVGGLFSSLIGIGTAMTGNLGAATQSTRNADANIDGLQNLQRCPNCGSSDYKQEIITFEKKL